MHAYKMAQNYQMWQLQALLDTLTYSTSASVPSKYVKYTATMIYGNWSNSTSVHPLSSSSSFNSVKLDYHKIGPSILLGYYLKWLLSLACVILDQENLHNFTCNSIICWKPCNNNMRLMACNNDNMHNSFLHLLFYGVTYASIVACHPPVFRCMDASLFLHV